MNRTPIEWADFSENPVRGCEEYSKGCTNCYAKRIDRRWGIDFHKIRFFPERIQEMRRFMPVPPFRRGNDLRPLCFVDDMSDTWQRKVPDSFIQDILDAEAFNQRLEWLNLTKRPERAKLFHFPENAWLGTSIEDMDVAYRLDHLLKSDASVKFLSLEPLLGSLKDLSFSGIDWIIVGGESDYSAPRPMDLNWARELRDKAVAAGIPFFFKQSGGRSKCDCHSAWGCRLLDGRVWNQFPGLSQTILEVA